MKKILILIMVLNVSAYGEELFVSSNGDDSNPGTKEKPFLTLLKARDETRRLTKKTGKMRKILVVLFI